MQLSNFLKSICKNFNQYHRLHSKKIITFKIYLRNQKKTIFIYTSYINIIRYYFLYLKAIEMYLTINSFLIFPSFRNISI